jgi:enoyl-[acyl-carrier protein] reductase I
MTLHKIDWKTNEKLAVGKGATVQEFYATVGKTKLEIDVAAWGEGHLKVNGREMAHVDDAKDRRQAFRELDKMAVRYLSGEPLRPDGKKKPSMIPSVKAKLLEGKKGLIVGIANENSIAWGCAKAFRAFGAELAVTYLNDKAKKYVQPLADELEAPIVMPLDVNAPGQLEAVFDTGETLYVDGAITSSTDGLRHASKNLSRANVTELPSVRSAPKVIRAEGYPPKYIC